jgi:hypothetical protein
MLSPESKSPSLRYEELAFLDEVKEIYEMNTDSIEFSPGSTVGDDEMPELEVLLGVIVRESKRAPLTLERLTFKSGFNFIIVTVNGVEYTVLDEGVFKVDDCPQNLSIKTVMNLRFWLSNTIWTAQKQNLPDPGLQKD